MTATNHTLTGAAIGFIIGKPELAIPLAIVSHYVLDAIPHFGASDPDKNIKSKIFRDYLIAEAFICAAIVAGLALLHPFNWVLAATCAFAAAAPDLLSFKRYYYTSHGKKWRPGLYSKFAHNIQWFEKPIGAVVEVTWAVACIIVLRPFL
jgi:hypothetical protein